jgi:hypothetical protein
MVFNISHLDLPPFEICQIRSERKIYPHHARSLHANAVGLVLMLSLSARDAPESCMECMSSPDVDVE